MKFYGSWSNTLISVARRAHVPVTRKRLVFHFQCKDDMKNCRGNAMVSDMSFEITLRDWRYKDFLFKCSEMDRNWPRRLMCFELSGFQ